MPDGFPPRERFASVGVRAFTRLFVAADLKRWALQTKGSDDGNNAGIGYVGKG